MPLGTRDCADVGHLCSVQRGEAGLLAAAGSRLRRAGSRRVRDFARRGSDRDAPTLDVLCSALYMRGRQGCCFLSDTVSRSAGQVPAACGILPEVITVVGGHTCSGRACGLVASTLLVDERLGLNTVCKDSSPLRAGRVMLRVCAAHVPLCAARLPLGLPRRCVPRGAAPCVEC